jgi:hypothetical protein
MHQFVVKSQGICTGDQRHEQKSKEKIACLNEPFNQFNNFSTKCKYVTIESRITLPSLGCEITLSLAGRVLSIWTAIRWPSLSRCRLTVCLLTKFVPSIYDLTDFLTGPLQFGCSNKAFSLR